MSARGALSSRGLRAEAVSPQPTHSASASAWLVALPAAALLVLAVVVLGPALGTLLEPSGRYDFWPVFERDHLVRPEPTEQARVLLGLAAPVLASAALLVLARHGRLPQRPPLERVASAALAVFVGVCVVYQYAKPYDVGFGARPLTAVYFTPVTLVVALLLTLAAAACLRDGRPVERVAALVRETHTKQVAALAVAGLFVVAWLLSAYNTERSLTSVNPFVRFNLPVWSDESFAVLGGYAPLVDYHAQYGHLWAYLGAAGMWALGPSIGSYALVMLAGTAGALAAVFATFRRVVGGNSLLGLALLLPFVATSFFMEEGPPANRYTPANLFSLFPIRYAGPCLLLWLVARRLDDTRPRRDVALFAVAGLAAINNLEFGAPAFAATFAALALGTTRREARELGRLATSALAGLLIACALVAALTLALAGSLPHVGFLLTYPRMFAREGLGMLPMPVLGLHLAIYCTFAAALLAATARAIHNRADRVLTGLLAWAGVFGLGACVYYAGRSHPQTLIALFSIWSLALSLLLVAILRPLLRARRWPTLAEALVLVGFGVTVCSLAQTPLPWEQLRRLADAPPAAQTETAVARRAVDQLTQPGEPVALLMKQGHQLAYELGLDDVAAYTDFESVPARQQWEEVVDALRDAGGKRLLIGRQRLGSAQVAWLARQGYTPQREVADLELVEFVAR